MSGDDRTVSLYLLLEACIKGMSTMGRNQLVLYCIVIGKNLNKLQSS